MQPAQKHKSNSSPSVVNLDQGRIPPQETGMERTILGAMMIDRYAIPEVFHMLSEEVFYKPQHALIFKAIREVYLQSDAVDIVTITNHLKNSGELEAVGGPAEIIDISNAVSSARNVEYHARIVLQKHIQREMIKIAATTIDQAFDETTDVFDLIDQAYSALNEVSEISVKPQESLIGSLIDPQIEKALKIAKGEIKPGIPTPIARMTNKTGGWRDSELIILAARPGMGKTALAIKYGMHASRLGYPTAFFSLEMSKEQLTNRIISSEARIPSDKFTNTGLTEEEAFRAHEAIKPIRDMQFIIDDTAALTIEDFQIRAKRMKSRYGIKLIIVDYLQLMSGSKGKGANREQEISKISRGLKLIAKELNIPVIALSQLSRNVESQGGHKRPMLSHLRESGAIEQDADVVQFLYRPEYYDIEQWDDYHGEATAGEAEYIVAKNRNGGLVRNRMAFEGQFTLFSDLEEPEIPHIPMPKSQDDFQPMHNDSFYPEDDEEPF